MKYKILTSDMKSGIMKNTTWVLNEWKSIDKDTEIEVGKFGFHSYIDPVYAIENMSDGDRLFIAEDKDTRGCGTVVVSRELRVTKEVPLSVIISLAIKKMEIYIPFFSEDSKIFEDTILREQLSIIKICRNYEAYNSRLKDLMKINDNIRDKIPSFSGFTIKELLEYNNSIAKAVLEKKYNRLMGNFINKCDTTIEEFNEELVKEEFNEELELVKENIVVDT